ncbi:MAG: response regulator [Desulfobacula sp.]|nr:response regulator [Desulfobacula sp.]
MIEIETMSILIVDDMKSMRLTIRKMLQNLKIGKKLRFAKNGKEGLEILNNVKCDIAIIDWNMPIMNGVQMLDQIRSDKSHRDMPVIMVTAESQRDIVSEVAETEVNAYLLKPLTLAALDEKIRAVVEKANEPVPATVHRLRAREFAEKKDFNAAIDEIKMALTYNSSASRLLRELGLLHFKIKKPGVAVKCLLKAASVNKQDVISRVHIADYYIKKNQLEKAGPFFLEILSLSTKYNDQALDFAEKLLIRGSRTLALNVFSKIMMRSKKQYIVREKIIDICLDKNELEYPLSLLEQSIKENPSNFDIIYKTGVVYIEIDDIEKALNNFIEVDRHVRGHINAKLQIARIYLDDGKVLQADDYINQILRIDPNNSAALDLRRQT